VRVGAQEPLGPQVLVAARVGGVHAGGVEDGVDAEHPARAADLDPRRLDRDRAAHLGAADADGVEGGRRRRRVDDPGAGENGGVGGVDGHVRGSSEMVGRSFRPVTNLGAARRRRLSAAAGLVY
jgi:hypothetical protein